MAFSKTVENRYNSGTTKNVPYTRMLNRIKIVELSKKLLSIVYKRKEKNILLAKI